MSSELPRRQMKQVLRDASWIWQPWWEFLGRGGGGGQITWTLTYCSEERVESESVSRQPVEAVWP